MRRQFALGQQAAGQGQRLLARVDRAIELRVFHGGQHGSKARTRRITRGDQVMPAEQRLRAHGLGW